MIVFCFVFLFSILCILCFILFCVLFLLLCCLFPIFVQVYRPLPSGGKPTEVINITHHISHHIISYIISYHIKTQKLSTCNDVSVTWVAVVLWMDLHQPWCRNNHSAIFLWTNLNQHFAYMFTSRHVPATELLHVSA